jgi:hypothetical protein
MIDAPGAVSTSEVITVIVREKVELTDARQ